MKLLIRLVAVSLVLSVGSAIAANDLPGDERALHVLNRLGYGPRPGDIDAVSRLGVDRYIDMQLHPESIPLPDSLSARLSSLPAIGMSAGYALSQFQMAQQAAKTAAANGNDAAKDAAKDARRDSAQRMAVQTAEARLIRAIESPRQLEEVMVDFWFNHFNVFAGKGFDRALVASYERDAIRPYALGRFRDLLGATAKHPAMLFYLDNWISVAPGFQGDPRRAQPAAVKVSGLNENYAREVMELHTLGVDGGYSQKDVTELARMLTGWTFAPREMVRTGDTFQFEPRRHDNGDKEWLGRHVSPNGRSEGEFALDVLAQHPATARHISFQLAQYFVADKPSPELVNRLAHRFSETRGDIRAVLATLFASPEFWNRSAVGSKFKTPYQYVVSSARAANLTVTNVKPLLGTLAQLGMPLYGCQTPDGYKNTEEAWLNPDALTRRINFATVLASGRLPLAKPEDAADDAGAMTDAVRAQKDRWMLPPVDAAQLMTTLGSLLSARTRDAVNAAQPTLRSALLLGSPDFMRH
jgi:uncharacterized protein (DUF1800 family)